MKTLSLFVIIVFGALWSASAGLYSVGNVNGSGTSLNQGIPDGQYPSGISSAISVSGAGGSLSFLTVTLNISGGYNGDLYVYLTHNGNSAVLLNRVGTTGDNAFGFSTSGFNNITLANDGAGGNIHNVESPVSGINYAPDGGNLTAFNGLSADGTWALFLSDGSHPDTSTLMGWSLDITAVPEPVDYALALFGALFVGIGVVRWYVASKSSAAIAS